MCKHRHNPQVREIPMIIKNNMELKVVLESLQRPDTSETRHIFKHISVYRKPENRNNTKQEDEAFFLSTPENPVSVIINKFSNSLLIMYQGRKDLHLSWAFIGRIFEQVVTNERTAPSDKIRRWCSEDDIRM